MEDKHLLYIILALVGLMFLSQLFTRKTSFGTVQFGMPKFSLPTKEPAKEKTPTGKPPVTTTETTTNTKANNG